MTNASLIARLLALIEGATDADKKHSKKIRKVLRKLKQVKNELEEKLEKIDNPRERQKIEQEIAVIQLQRGKGIRVYKDLKAGRDKSKKKKPGPSSAAAGTGESTPESS